MENKNEPKRTTKETDAKYIESLGGLGPLHPELKAELDKILEKIRNEKNS
jgi:hypothetical protein